jgi:hypothetical protein
MGEAADVCASVAEGGAIVTPEQIERAAKSRETARHAFYAGWLRRGQLFANEREEAFDHWWGEVMELATTKSREELLKEQDGPKPVDQCVALNRKKGTKS